MPTVRTGTYYTSGLGAHIWLLTTRRGFLTPTPGCNATSLAVVFGLAHKRIRIDTDRPSDQNKLCCVETTLACLNLGNKGLALADEPAQIHLRKPRIPPRSNKKIDHILVEVAVE